MRKILSNKIATLIIGMIIGMVLMTSFKPSKTVQENNVCASVEQTNSKLQVVVTRHLTSNTVKPEDNIVLDKDDHYFEMNDGSWYLYNESKGIYIFQPVMLGDWDYTVNSMEELDNIIDTYFGMCNEGSF